jgi:hypothetical protein
MIDSSNIKALRIKSFGRNQLDHNSSYQKVTERDEWCFEDYLRHKPCSLCGKDHCFKPYFERIETSIESTSELIALFFNEGSNRDE